MKRFKASQVGAWALAALVAALAGLAALSYVSPWRALDRAVEAARGGDVQTLSQLVDWDSVRDRNTERIAKAQIAQAGLAVGDERINELVLGVHAAVSKVATAQNVALAAKSVAQNKSALRIKGRYLSMGVFVFAVENMDTKSAVSLRLRRLGPMSWRIDDAALIDARLLGAP